MNNNALSNKTFWIGWIVVFVITEIYGFLVHEVGLSATYESLAAVFRARDDMASMMWMMFVGDAVYLLIFCYIYTFGCENKGVIEGVRFGALMGLFYAISFSVVSYVVYPITGQLALVWFCTGVIGFVIVGAVFAAVYKPSTG